jgi:hypothetical protein
MEMDGNLGLLDVRSRRFDLLLRLRRGKQLTADGFPVTDELLARLSPLQYDHINFLGRYAFSQPPAPGLRQLRDPHSDVETDDGGYG